MILTDEKIRDINAARPKSRGRTAFIVCEGACTPRLQEFDLQVRTFVQEKRMAPIPDTTLLTHRIHVQDGSEYRCTVCGWRRKF